MKATGSVDDVVDELRSSPLPFSNEEEVTVKSPSPHQVKETFTNISSKPSASLCKEDDNGVLGSPDDEPELIGLNGLQSRAYQLEMLEKSLQENVIVATDTGTGKTQVAVLRIKAELRKCPSEQIAWFLAPNVSLCEQQFNVYKSQDTANPARLLTGRDNVDLWSAAIWSAVLADARVLISTYQVLLDALSHGFVKISNLAIVVFDEAHNCVNEHPGRKIMTNFYHQQKEAGNKVPAILGLTASPSIRSVADGLETLERTLDARCISPTLQRDDLLKFTNKPQIYHETYLTKQDIWTPAMYSLNNAYLQLDILNDPKVVALRADPSERKRRELRKVLLKLDTFSQDQMKGLCGRAEETLRELGPWAVDKYIWSAISQYLERLSSSKSEFFENWKEEEKNYLADVVRSVGAKPVSVLDPDAWSMVSRKIQLLVQQLLRMVDPVVGIIFVKERVTVTLLADLLSQFPAVCAKYRIGTMVGTSNFSGRKRALYEFVRANSGLEGFRRGDLNLLITTSVLEEGIDVPACNLVVCFDPPQTPKSFIQRRGRARMRGSRLIMLSNTSEDMLRKFQLLEEEMKKLYEDEEREAQQRDLPEAYNNDFHVLEIAGTGARLDLNNSKSHLEHFCSVLSRTEYVDSRPDYIIKKHEDGRVSAKVVLPSVLPEDVRHASSQLRWPSEKTATKDAAFCAYRVLYDNGFINDNLLPFSKEADPAYESRLPIEYVDGQLDPWNSVAAEWASGRRWRYILEDIDQCSRPLPACSIILPVEIDQAFDMRVYIDDTTSRNLRLSPGEPITDSAALALPDHTSLLLALHFGHRWMVKHQSHILQVICGEELPPEQPDPRPVTEEDLDIIVSRRYLIRNDLSVPFLCEGFVRGKPKIEDVKKIPPNYDEAPMDGLYLIVRRLPRRADFLHQLNTQTTNQMPTSTLYPAVLPIESARLDTIPAEYAMLGMLLPSIIHEIEVTIVAKELRTTLLRPLGITDHSLLREAISARSAHEPTDYERLEFLGDSILKFCVSISVAVEHLDWPEGYLSFQKDRIVSNTRLSKASIDKGLSKFILTRIFTGQKWRPLYRDGFPREIDPSSGRHMSTKTLADVVESLIGAAFYEGGVPKALECISLFVDEFPSQDLNEGRTSLSNHVASDVQLPRRLKALEKLIGYEFEKKAMLIEAMTHGSVAEGTVRPYERLEFLGDAILDKIIVTRLFRVTPPLAHHQMHTLKTAMVNGDFLAFIAMNHGIVVDQAVGMSKTASDPTVEIESQFLALWNFMQFDSMQLGFDRFKTAERFGRLQGPTVKAIESGTHYPWALLAGLQAKKFYSDLFEALLGAVWIDSGSLQICEDVLDKFGILPYLERILRENVHVQHPKEELGRLAGQDKVIYNVIFRDTLESEQEYCCNVVVGDRLVIEMSGGVGKEEVQTKAAEAAVAILSEEMRVRLNGAVST